MEGEIADRGQWRERLLTGGNRISVLLTGDSGGRDC